MFAFVESLIWPCRIGRILHGIRGPPTQRRRSGGRSRKRSTAENGRESEGERERGRVDVERVCGVGSSAMVVGGVVPSASLASLQLRLTCSRRLGHPELTAVQASSTLDDFSQRALLHCCTSGLDNIISSPHSYLAFIISVPHRSEIQSTCSRALAKLLRNQQLSRLANYLTNNLFNSLIRRKLSNECHSRSLRILFRAHDSHIQMLVWQPLRVLVPSSNICLSHQPNNFLQDNAHNSQLTVYTIPACAFYLPIAGRCRTGIYKHIRLSAITILRSYIIYKM